MQPNSQLNCVSNPEVDCTVEFLTLKTMEDLTEVLRVSEGGLSTFGFSFNITGK